MKVMLKQDVHGTGKAGDIVDVSDGYANNFLIPRKLAIPANAETINAANIKKAAAKHRVEVQRRNAKALASNMSGYTVKVYAKCGDNGRLFGAITGKEIAAALSEQYDISLDKKKLGWTSLLKQSAATAWLLICSSRPTPNSLLMFCRSKTDG